MEKELFDDLVTSLQEAKAIKKGELAASRRFKIHGLDVKAIRGQTGLSQTEFADLIKISPRTLQNWEQKRRYPTGPAATLLKLVSAQPDFVIRSLSE